MISSRVAAASRLALVGTLALGCGQSVRHVGAAGTPNAPSTPESLAFRCASELTDGQVTLISSEPAGLVSQHARGADRPALAVGPDGQRHLFYRDDMPSGEGRIVYRQGAAGETAWGDGVAVSFEGYDADRPAAAARGTTLAAAWLERHAGSADLVVSIERVGQSSVGPVALDVNPLTVPSVAIDDTGAVAVLWEGQDDATTGGRPLLVARTTSRGVMFSEPESVGATTGLDHAALLLTHDHTFVAWSDAYSIEGGLVVQLAAAAAGAPFDPPNAVAGETFVPPSLLEDADGSLLLLWAPATTETGSGKPLGLALGRSTDGGLSFTTLATLDENNSRDLFLAGDGKGTVLAAWTACLGPYCSTALAQVVPENVGLTSVLVAGSEPNANSGPIVAGLGTADAGTTLVWTTTNGALGEVLSQTFDPSTLGYAGGDPQPVTRYDETAPEAIGADASKPALVALSDAEVLVAWSQEANRLPSSHAGIFVAGSHDGGLTFDAPLRIADNAPSLSLPCRFANLGEPSVADPTAAVALAALGSQVALAWSDEVTLDATDTSCQLEYTEAYGGLITRSAATPEDIFVALSSDGGVTFDAPVNVSHSVDPSLRPALAFDADGALIVAWEEHVQGGSDTCYLTERSQVFAARAANGPFSEPVLWSDPTQPGSCSDATEPVLARGDGALLAAWLLQSADGNGTRAIAAAQPAGGTVTQPATAVTLPYESGLLSTLSAAASGSSFVALGFASDTAFQLARSNDGGQSFEPPAAVDLYAGASSLALASKGANDIWATWAAHDVPDFGEIERASLDGSGVVGARADVSSSLLDSDFPRALAAADERALVTWEDATPNPGVRSVVLGCR